MPNAFLPWHRVSPDANGNGRFTHAKKRIEGIQKAMEAINR
jgi:hypothetical protein